MTEEGEIRSHFRMLFSHLSQESLENAFEKYILKKIFKKHEIHEQQKQYQSLLYILDKTR